MASSTDSTDVYCVIDGKAVKNTDASATKALAYKSAKHKNMPQARELNYEYNRGDKNDLYISQSNIATLADRKGFVSESFDNGYMRVSVENASKALNFSISQKDNAKVTEKLKAIGFTGQVNQFSVGKAGTFPGNLYVSYRAVESKNYQNPHDAYIYYYNPVKDSFEYVNKMSRYEGEVSIYLSTKYAGTYIVTDIPFLDQGFL